MKQVIDATIQVQLENTFLDHIKSDYMLTAQHLIQVLLSSQNGMNQKTEKDVAFLTNHLIEAKDGLIDLIDIYEEVMDRLSEEIENYLKEVEK